MWLRIGPCLARQGSDEEREEGRRGEKRPARIADLWPIQRRAEKPGQSLRWLFRTGLVLNVRTFRLEIVMASPVTGFLPLRSALFLT